MLLIAAVSGSAAAAWERVGENKEFTGYADPVTIRRAGHLVQMWVLRDYKAVQNFDSKPYKSVREQFEYDCRDERLQLLAVVAHFENSAKGRVVYSATFDTEDWQPVRRGTMNESLRKFACGKR